MLHEVGTQVQITYIFGRNVYTRGLVHYMLSILHDPTRSSQYNLVRIFEIWDQGF